jgi:hypothetical protein
MLLHHSYGFLIAAVHLYSLSLSTATSICAQAFPDFTAKNGQQLVAAVGGAA